MSFTKSNISSETRNHNSEGILRRWCVGYWTFPLCRSLDALSRNLFIYFHNLSELPMNSREWTIFQQQFEPRKKIKSNSREQLKQNIHFYTVKQFIYTTDFTQCIHIWWNMHNCIFLENSNSNCRIVYFAPCVHYPPNLPF